jgi:hypothetical protein
LKGFNRFNRLIIARLEIRDVLPTTRMNNIFLRFGYSVLAWNSALSKLHAETVMIQCRKSSRLGKTEPSLGIIPASQLDLHMPLPFSWS